MAKKLTAGTPLTVSQLTAQIKFSLGELFSGCLVQGEISDCTRSASGHTYFSLKDSGAKLSAILWSSTASRMKFRLEEGLEVVCRGNIDVYAPRGNYQLIVDRIEPLGQGSLQLAFKQLHQRLAAEGLFDARHKKPLPFLPRTIGVVTSPDGAAIRDFLQVLNRRFPNVEVLVIPVRVQGRGAEREIAEGIRRVNRLRMPPEVLVVCRGGGSAEDLWCFNEEVVCRAIFASKIPVVSAVGHEVDVTLSDLVADVRALTPSEAAERIVPKKSDLERSLQLTKSRLVGSLRGRFHQARAALFALADRPVLHRPLDRLNVQRQMLDELLARMQRSLNESTYRRRRDVEGMANTLNALSPLKILARGYCVSTDQSGKVIQDVTQVELGEPITTRIQNGTIVSVVRDVFPKT
jgi:exodeoxyribonuclease VII large subunit